MPSHWATVCLGGILALYSLGTENPRLHLSKDATYVCLWWHRFDNCRLATAYINNDRVGCRSGAFSHLPMIHALYRCSISLLAHTDMLRKYPTWEDLCNVARFLGFSYIKFGCWLKADYIPVGIFGDVYGHFFVTFYVVNVTECKILLMSMTHTMHFDPANIHHDGNIERFALENKCSFSVPLHFACAIDVEIILLDWKTEFYVHLCELMCNP